MYFFPRSVRLGRRLRVQTQIWAASALLPREGVGAGKSLDLCCLCLFFIGSQLTQACLEHTMSPRASEIAGSHLRDSGPSLAPGSDGAHRRYEATRRRQRPGEARMSVAGDRGGWEPCWNVDSLATKGRLSRPQVLAHSPSLRPLTSLKAELEEKLISEQPSTPHLREGETESKT